jgi:hypothetical protein
MLPMSRTPTVATLYKFNEVDGGLAQIQYSVVQGERESQESGQHY